MLVVMSLLCGSRRKPFVQISYVSIRAHKALSLLTTLNVTTSIEARKVEANLQDNVRRFAISADEGILSSLSQETGRTGEKDDSVRCQISDAVIIRRITLGMAHKNGVASACDLGVRVMARDQCVWREARRHESKQPMNCWII